MTSSLETDVAAADRRMLRHAVATVAYRARKAVAGADASFGSFRAGASSRSAGEIVSHVADLFDWALSLAKGSQAWPDSRPLAWDLEIDRCFESLGALDAFLASDQGLGVPAERLFQGAIADALTHVGQVAMLRRLAGCPIKGENYFVADIVVGRVGLHQSAPRREFD